MNFKNLKLKLAASKKRFKKEGKNIDPNIYWKSVVFMGFVLSVSFFLFGLYFSDKIKKESSIIPDTSMSTKISDKERLQKVLEYFAEKEIKSQQILLSPAPVIDPSI